MEMTTTQLVTNTHEQRLPEESIDKVNVILTKSDLVKFAKLIPPADENASCLQLAFDYVNETKLIFEKADHIEEESTDVVVEHVADSEAQPDEEEKDV